MPCGSGTLLSRRSVRLQICTVLSLACPCAATGLLWLLHLILAFLFRSRETYDADTAAVFGGCTNRLLTLSIYTSCRYREQGLDNDDISRLKGRHEALLASREALGKGANGGGGGDDFIPLDGKVSRAPYFTLSAGILPLSVISTRRKCTP